ncbi:MAG: hypothetical protein ACP5FH_03615 [Terracidiphilus sp.]
MSKLNNETILLALAVAISLAALLQAVFLLGILIAIRKATRSLHEEIENLRTALMPVLDDARDTVASTREILLNVRAFLVGAQAFVNRVAPKIEAVTADMAEMTSGLRAQSEQLQFSAQEILERVRRQSKRMDAMFSSLLDTVDRAGGFVTETVSRPVRQVSSILRSARAVVDALRKPWAGRSPNPSAHEDHFV